jgi:anaerobic selenocysteine-containing dehydrogenase
MMIMLDRRAFLASLSGATAGVSVAALQTGCSAPAAGENLERRFGYCRLCTSNCGLQFSLHNGRILGVRGDRDSFTKGFCCPTGASINHVLNDPHRLRQPMKRVDGGFVPCSWNEALDAITHQLRSISKRHGGRAIAMQTGYVFVRHPIVEQLMHLGRQLGTPNVSSVENICEAAIRLGETLTYGRGTYADFVRASVIVLWGANPFVTLPVYWDLIAQRMAQGAKLVVIDPFRTDGRPLARSGTTIPCCSRWWDSSASRHLLRICPWIPSPSRPG